MTAGPCVCVEVAVPDDGEEGVQERDGLLGVEQEHRGGEQGDVSLMDIVLQGGVGGNLLTSIVGFRYLFS